MKKTTLDPRINEVVGFILNLTDTGGFLLLEEGSNPRIYSLSGDLLKKESFEELRPLQKFQQEHHIFRYLIVVEKITPTLINSATQGMKKSQQAIIELNTLLEQYPDASVCYAVSHASRGPLGSLTVKIGGDCYRNDQENLSQVINRITQLSIGMEQKSNGVFPDMPALHGGKKGEWLFVSREGNHIGRYNDEAKKAAGSYILPKGISFLNDYLIRLAGFDVKPDNILWPDSISPDVFSGEHWAELTELWQKRGVDLLQVTCLPAALGGVKHPSSNPTALGVATTTFLAIDKIFPKQELSVTKIIIEAAGGVTSYLLEYLDDKLAGKGLHNITVFDINENKIKRISEKFPEITAVVSDHNTFYSSINGESYDVWINNGVGNNTTPAHIEQLLHAGVRFFTGGANNSLEEKSEHESLILIENAGAYYMKDQFVSGGGWVLALIDIIERTVGQHKNASDELTFSKICKNIIRANSEIFSQAFEVAAKTNTPLHQVVRNEIDRRVAESRKTIIAKEMAHEIAANTIREVL
ncbi:MAG: hypothetical protein Q8O88_02490 [bacterium]|nr:hypothetical protein [bacterium]